MEPWVSKWTHCAFCVFAIVLAARACTVPSKIQGNWEVMEASTSTLLYTVTINSTSLTGVTFWNKTLAYGCFAQQSNYYVFVSELTSLFDLYDVHIYFCWFLQSYSIDMYRLYELTDKVLYTVEERAKAYLNTTTPTINDVCEVTFDSSLIYKQMQLEVRRADNGGNTISVSTTAFLLAALALL